MGKLTMWLVAAAYLSAWKLLPLFPEVWVRRGFALVGEFVWRIKTKGVRNLHTNMALALPAAPATEIGLITRRAVRSYMRYWGDVFLSEKWSKERLVADMELVGEGAEFLRAHLNSGQGLVGGVPHMGNMDRCGLAATSNGWKVTTVAERLKPDALYRRFTKYRGALGIEVIAHDDDRMDSLRLLIRRAKEGHLVALVADRDLRTNGVEVDFMGTKTLMSAGPALVALATGCPLVSLSSVYVGQSIHINCGPPLAVPKTGTLRAKVAVMTQALADRFATDIKTSPHNWHMWQPIGVQGFQAE